MFDRSIYIEQMEKCDGGIFETNNKKTLSRFYSHLFRQTNSLPTSMMLECINERTLDTII